MLCVSQRVPIKVPSRRLKTWKFAGKQIASTRGDLYPPEFTKELESLQDDVPPVEFDTTVDYDIFKEFDPTPRNPGYHERRYR